MVGISMTTSIVNKRVLVTGHQGLVGSALLRRLRRESCSLITATRAEVDLRDQREVDAFFASEKPDLVIHAAGTVGGIHANSSRPADFLYDNTMMHATVLHSAWRHGVEKLLYLGSSCIYPRDCEQPIDESALLSGPLESTNEAYAISKISGVLACRAYRRQHGCNFISAMPTNLYGPNDNFDPLESHVVAALIRKFHDAREQGRKAVTIWGTGTATREFLHVDDLADACVFLMEQYEAEEAINLGTGEATAIADLAEIVRTVVYPDASIDYDATRPDGHPRRHLDVSRIHQLGWRHSIALRNGIESTYDWYRSEIAAANADSPGEENRPTPATTPAVAMTNDLPKRALITGITGQDGSYLAELLLSKGYHVWGMIRRASLFNTQRIDHIYQDPHEDDVRLRLCYGDLSDASSINTIIEEIQPHEIYNLGAQSHVKVSFEIPEYTGDVTGLGTLRILECVRSLGLDCRVYQASSSELYGKATEVPQSETTRFYPRSPYAAAKAYAFHVTRNYRESYNMFAVNGILFNHESPRRGATFVTRKITRAVAAISAGQQERLFLGNLDAKRDWGFAGDYVRAMWLMLQADEPEDFVIATGVTASVRDFCELAFARAGLPLNWSGSGVEERGLDSQGRTLVEIDPRYFRPAEVEHLIGDASKAKEKLGWEPEVDLEGLVNMMVDADIAQLAAD